MERFRERHDSVDHMFTTIEDQQDAPSCQEGQQAWQRIPLLAEYAQGSQLQHSRRGTGR